MWDNKFMNSGIVYIIVSCVAYSCNTIFNSDSNE